MNDLKISASTIARTAALVLALTNQVLSACGKPVLPIESELVVQQQLYPACARRRPAHADAQGAGQVKKK